MSDTLKKVQAIKNRGKGPDNSRKAKGSIGRRTTCAAKDCDSLTMFTVNRFGRRFHYTWCRDHLKAAQVGPFNPKKDFTNAI